MKQSGVGDTTARKRVKKAVLGADLGGGLFLDIPIGNRICKLRIEKEGSVKNGPLWLVREWCEP